jgi:S-adenosylmethionine-diacylglycerol 3-amino-3-carboxypropyl transferase
MTSEIASRARFSIIRYAQCWEDADVLLEALDIGPAHTCLAIASAGDNALAMLGRGPRRVVAIDLSPAQLACVELRVAAYRELKHEELLRLIGSRPGNDRMSLYRRCRGLLSPDTRRFWDSRPSGIDGGIGGAGKFEDYLRLFRTRVLPLIHSGRTVEALFEPRTRAGREAFYSEHWSNQRWHWMFKTFFSRFVVGHLARDPSFFDYVNGSVSAHLLERARYALTVLDPAENPYLQWIFFGHHSTSLPYSLRRENHEAIRNNLDRLEWRRQSLKDFLQSCDASSVDRFNLSDVFEYMSADDYTRVLESIVRAATPGARLAYWNMLVSRSRPDAFADRLRPLRPLAEELHRRGKAFFYSTFVVEEVL